MKKTTEMSTVEGGSLCHWAEELHPAIPSVGARVPGGGQGWRHRQRGRGAPQDFSFSITSLTILTLLEKEGKKCLFVKE